MPRRCSLRLGLLLLDADVDDAARGGAHHDRLGVEPIVVRDGMREPAPARSQLVNPNFINKIEYPGEGEGHGTGTKKRTKRT